MPRIKPRSYRRFSSTAPTQKAGFRFQRQFCGGRNFSTFNQHLWWIARPSGSCKTLCLIPHFSQIENNFSC